MVLTVPSPHAIAIMILTVIAFWFFASGRVRIEITCLLLIAVLAFGFYFFPFEREGRYTGMEVAFGGFSHEALVAICCLMILGRGLLVTGALRPVARLLGIVWRLNKTLGMLLTISICGALSMFVNDTPVLVLALPILLELSAHSDMSASKTLMPANGAILLGGMATTIGTSTNLLVISVAQDLGLPRFGVFQFTGVALTAAAVALPYIWLIMPRLLPNTSAATAEAQRIFDASLHVVEGTTLIGVKFSEVAQSVGNNLSVTGVTRRGVRLSHLHGDKEVEIGDGVLVAGTMAQLRSASEALKAPLVRPDVLELTRAFGTPADADRIIAEMVVGSQSNLIGQSVRSAQIANRYGVAVIGTYRPSHSIFDSARHPIMEGLEIGDVLLLEGDPSRIRDLEFGESGMVLEGAAQIPRTDKASLALLIMASVVIVATTKIVPIAIAALAGSIAMLVTGCLKFERVDRALSGQVIVLVAASIALGRALVETGAAMWLGSVFAYGLQGVPPAGVVAAIMVFAALLTNFISNTASAAVTTPIAISLAAQLGVTAEPLVAAVLFGANLCFVTPMAYQTNLMIMTAGGYRFSDYVRAGLPLTILMIVTLSVLLTVRYNL
jgi:di/tricarboxylate transporter